MGFIGLAIGVGATVSTTLAGWIADAAGAPIAYLGLALVGLAAVGRGIYRNAGTRSSEG